MPTSNSPMDLLRKTFSKLAPEFFLLPIVALAQILWSTSGTFWRSGHAGLLGDAWILHTIACNYLDHGVFSYIGDKATLMQLPGYPYIIAQIYQYFGRDPRWVYVFQILITCIGTPVLIYALRTSLGTWRWIFAILWILDIHHLLYSSCLTTEFLICSLWVSAWLLCAKGFQQSKFGLYALGIFCLGLAAWIKPLSLYVIIFFTMAILFHLLRQWRKFLLILGLTFGVYALTLSPLLYRNYTITHEFPRYSTISSFNFWYFNIPYYYSMKGEGSVNTIRERQVDLMRQKLNAEGSHIAPIPPIISHDRNAHIKALGINEFQYAKLADGLSAEFIKEHFFSYLYFHLKHGIQIFTISNLSWLKLVYQSFEAHSFGLSPQVWWQTLRAWNLQSWLLFCRLVEVSSTLTYCTLGMIGLFLCWWQKRWTVMHSLSVAFILYLPLVCGVNVWGRFRFLIMPMLIFMAIEGFRGLWPKNCTKSDKDSTPSNIAT